MRKQQGRRKGVAVCGSLLLLFLWACGGDTESGSHAALVSLHNERLSAALRQATVGEVVAEPGRQTGIHMQLEEAAVIETVSVEFTNLSVDEGVKRILQGKTYALAYSDERRGSFVSGKLVAIWVLASKTGPIPNGSIE